MTKQLSYETDAKLFQGLGQVTSFSCKHCNSEMMFYSPCDTPQAKVVEQGVNVLAQPTPK